MDLKQTIANEIHAKYRYDAQRRGLAFELTRQDVANIIYLDCAYCGAKPNNLTKYRWPGGRPLPRYNGMDRIDNKQGYYVDNVNPCCPICNSSKGTMSLDEWKKWLRDITKSSFYNNKNSFWKVHMGRLNIKKVLERL